MKKATRSGSGRRRSMNILLLNKKKKDNRKPNSSPFPGGVPEQPEPTCEERLPLVLRGGCDLYFPHILWLWKRGNISVVPDNTLKGLAAWLYAHTRIESANGSNPRMNERTILIRLYQLLRERDEFPDTYADYFIRIGIFYLLMYARHRKEKLLRAIKRISAKLSLFLHSIF